MQNSAPQRRSLVNPAGSRWSRRRGSYDGPDEFGSSDFEKSNNLARPAMISVSSEIRLQE
jgi:hypothetical protein